MIRAIVVDDEKPAIDALCDLLSEFSDIEILAQFSNPQQALDDSCELNYDIAFLDIEMPGMNGLQLGERLLEANPSKEIIFVTAYDAYAIEAFEVCALDYLLKPVSSRRMKKTVERLRLRAEQGESGAASEAAPEDRTDAVSDASPAARQGASLRERARIQCFGRFEIAMHGDEDVFLNWRTAKVRELLAFLVQHREQIVSKSKIIDALWPDLELERAAVYLHTCIYQIRKTLKQHGLEKQLVIQFIQDGYQLSLYHMICDEDEFREGAEAGGLAGEYDWELKEASERLFKSGYFAQDDFPWALDRQAELEALYIELVGALARRDQAEGNQLSAIRRWNELIKREPYNEEYHEQLLRLYAQKGSRSKIVMHYTEMEERFRNDLDIEPGPATKTLYRNLLADLELRGMQR